MKKTLLCYAAILLAGLVQAQVGIGTTTPHASAQLDVSSTNKGFLPPRLTYLQRSAIESPVGGLMIYNLETKKMNYFDGTLWKNMDGTSDSWGIGSLYQGGRVAYIFQPGDPGYIAGQTNGLIAQTADISGGSQWGCWGSLIPGADGTVLGTGAQNTSDIVANCFTTTIAAQLCVNTPTYASGFTDWYLPSRDELKKIFPNRVAIGQFAATNYWSSSEISNGNAYAVSYVDGLESSKIKTDGWRVRAIRTINPIYASNVQERLNNFETPLGIFNSGMPLDSLYGKNYKGGIIAYLNTSTGKGFVAAPTDQSAGAQWGCQGTLIPGADGTTIGTGAQNTIDIVAGCATSGIAAKLCADLILNNYSDWFLPSRDELLQLYQNLHLKGYGVFANGRYWSSSEGNITAAHELLFSNGSNTFSAKSDNYTVRAIRSF